MHDYIHSTYYTGVADVKYTDFEPICLIASTPSVLTASPKTPWNDWKGLLADAKARPGQITVGATLASTSHFFPALIEKAAGIKFKYVSYEGLAPRMNAILGGHIDLTDSNLTQKGKVEAGAAQVPRHRHREAQPRDAERADAEGTRRQRGLRREPRRAWRPRARRPTCSRSSSRPAPRRRRSRRSREAMKLQATDVRYLGRKQYAEWLKENDDLNKTLAKDLGLLKR